MIAFAPLRRGSPWRLTRLPILQLVFLLAACSTAPVTPVVDHAIGHSEITAHAGLINLNSPEGERLLFSSRARQDYLPLSIHFETQQNLAYCGAASMAMVLNALELPAPIAPEYKRYPMFTQTNLFTDQTDRVVRASTVARQGMTLEELGQLLKTYDLDTKVIFSSGSSPDQFRRLAAENLKQPGNFVLVNYLRTAIGQETGGHISPLAAYHEESDRFLILDVARFKYPPIWVKTLDLWRAMNTQDRASGKNRGFVLVGRTASNRP